MKKKKSLILKIFSILMICCMSFLFVGCTKSKEDKVPEDEEIDEEIGDISDEELDGMALPMYGARVLYREEDYFNGSAENAGQNINYYSQYAFVVMQALYNTYGVLDSSLAPSYLGLNTDTYNQISPYLYDSIRYQVDTAGMVNKKQVQNEDGTWGAVESLTDEYFIVGVAPANAWNWTFDYNHPNTKSIITSVDAAIYEANNKIYSIRFDSKELYQQETVTHYSRDFGIGTKYEEIYLGADSNSDLVKAMEYAIYSLALDFEPKDVSVVPNASGYSVSIGGESVETALGKIKESFAINASFVGLTARQISKLSNWICEEVIGVSASNGKDEFKYYDAVIEKIDKNGNVTYEFTAENTDKSGMLGRNYTSTVSTIVGAVCRDVSIGQSDSWGDGTIDDKFLSSRIKDYRGDNFLVTESEHLSAANGIPEAEYQSVVLMLPDDTTLEGMEIALKYDADSDGETEGVWDKNKYLDMIVELNYYHDGQMYVIGSEQARVYDGPFDPHYDGEDKEMQALVDEMYNGEIGGNVMFFDYKAAMQKYIEEAAKAGESNIPTMEDFEKLLDEEEAITLGEFNVNLGGGAFAEAIKKDGILLVGSTPARRYYELVENQPNQKFNIGGVEKEMTYTTGRFNKSVIASDANKCDYLEITYKVLKDPEELKNGVKKNYKFYTGIYFAY